MQSAKVLVAVGGDIGNTVPKIVTAAEIPVLQGIHGDEAVHNIDPLDAPFLNSLTGQPITNREELMRLKGIYGGARDGENHRVIDVIYPGAGARLPETIAELDLPEQFFKPTARASAKPVEAVEAAGETVAPKASRKGKKADTEAAPAAAADTGDEGVNDMPDGEKLFA
ncbi:MAG TPA: hypothetical protein VN106_06910 [Sphingomicrobium sp.]|nr:hypothetical protein [Sphingomicrobium sp.]